jgi:hypothetical protein
MNLNVLEEELRNLQLRMLRVETAVTVSNGDVVSRLLRLEGTVVDIHRILQSTFAVHQNQQNAAPMPSSDIALVDQKIDSTEPNRLCTFPTCPDAADTASGKVCSGTAAARHMAACKFCPVEAERYLHIALHLGSFGRSPRVVAQDMCCWCLLPFEDGSTDIRTRHRKNCRYIQIVALADPQRRAAKSAQLSNAWMSTSPMHSGNRKRERGQFSPVISFQPPKAGMSYGDAGEAVDGYAVESERIPSGSDGGGGYAVRSDRNFPGSDDGNVLHACDLQDDFSDVADAVLGP